MALAASRVLRRIARRPATPIAIIATLTVSFAIAISMFSVLYGVVLKPLPYPDGDRIVRIVSMNPASGVSRSGLTAAEAIQGLPGVDGFAATGYSISSVGITVVVDDVPRQINVAVVSPGFFRVFDVVAERGRVISEADAADARPVIVLNHNAWRDLGADAEIVGKQLQHLDGSLEVVGVMPEYFGPSDTPVAYQSVQPSRIEAYFGTRRLIDSFARISRDANIEAAATELTSRLKAVAETQGTTRDDWRFRMIPLVDEVAGTVRPTLFALTAIAIVILTVATATVTTLMSIRLSRRESDIAIERAVGSTPASVFVTTAMELLVLVMVAVVAGWIAALVSVRTVVAWLAGDVLPRPQDISVFSGPVVAAGIAASMIVVSLALLPMRRILILEPATWLSPYSVLKWSKHWFGFLPVISVALTTASLATAVALSVSAIRMNSIDMGFITENVGAVFLVRRQPPEELDLFLRTALERIDALPGVIETSAILAGSPASPNFLRSTAEAPEASEPIRTTLQFASAGYHSFLGVTMLSGRDIEATDILGMPPVAIINETLSRILFRGLDPIGKSITLSGTEYEIVGTAADRKNAGLRAPPEPEIVMSIHQWAGPAATVLIKYSQLRPTWATEAVAAIREVDPLQSVTDFQTLEESLNENRRTMTFITGTLWSFSLLTLLLGILGINAIVAAAQSSSVRETSLRMALGERRFRSAIRVLGIGLRPAVIGAIIGAVAAVPVVGVFENQLFLTGDGMKLSIAVMTGFALVLSSIVAGALPAYRAARTDMVRALRVE